MVCLANNQQKLHVFTRCYNEQKRIRRCLERDFWVEFEGWNSLAPRLELLRLGVDVVVEDCSVARELDCLELIHPPARELDAPVYQLQTSNNTC